MPEQIEASHILISHNDCDGMDAARSREDALAEITELKSQIDGGADFAKLAEDNSDCPSGRQGGALGQFAKGMMVPEFEAAAFDLDPGGISEIVETDFGYHLIQRTG